MKMKINNGHVSLLLDKLNYGYERVFFLKKIIVQEVKDRKEILKVYQDAHDPLGIYKNEVNIFHLVFFHSKLVSNHLYLLFHLHLLFDIFFYLYKYILFLFYFCILIYLHLDWDNK